MAVSLSSLGSKTMRRLTLTSGTSWTVPAGVTFVNVQLIGGGGSSAGGYGNASTTSGTGNGHPGESIWSTVSTTPGASIAYAIGAGGAAVDFNLSGNNGGTTTFTGATSAAGGNGGKSGVGNSVGTRGTDANNGGYSILSQNNNVFGNSGGAGQINIEYWV